jgi:8-oxo-dGTP diphosphatase|tara:strand:- start:520 stop:798 length:279 start_codon:yes stop_codon:yes gene_type:complete
MNPPHGCTLPVGIVDYGEPLEAAVIREALEEASLNVQMIKQSHTYSDPRRDLRQHTLSTVFIETAKGIPKAQDDAKNIGVFDEKKLTRGFNV